MAGTNARSRAALNKSTTSAPEAKSGETTKKTPVVDFSALAAQAKAAPALPKMGRSTQDNPFVAKVRESFEKQQAVELPPVPNEALTPVKVAIRRGATLADLGVSIRETVQEDGTIVITFMGKTRNKRSTDDSK